MLWLLPLLLLLLLLLFLLFVVVAVFFLLFVVAVVFIVCCCCYCFWLLLLFSLFVVVFLLFVVVVDICGDPEWSYFNGYCYFTSTTCTSWLTAKANCTAFGSNLVTVHNQEENVYIQHRHNGEKSWIGLNDRNTEGLFTWTPGEIRNFSFWAPNQPNNFRDEDCVHTLGLGHGYRWNDVPCESCHKYTCAKGSFQITGFD